MVVDIYKQAIVVRKDLKMEKGKIATQVAHAAVSAYRKSLSMNKSAVKRWESYGEKKVVLKVGSLRNLKSAFRKAKEAGLPCVMIRDSGKTQVKPGSVTCIGIGPAAEGKIDSITKDLKLL